jgi:hypothetical protein
VKTKFDETDKVIYFLQHLGEDLIVVSSDGIYKYEKSTDDWKLVTSISPVSSIENHDNRLFLGLFIGGVASGNRLDDLRLVDKTFDKNVQYLLFDEVLYICTDEGLYVHDVTTGTIEKSTLDNENIHNQVISRIVSVGDHLYAFGCEFIYFKGKKEHRWHKMDFRQNFCVADTWVEKNAIYFSTTGDGIYILHTPDGKPTKLETSHYHPNIQKLKFRNGKLLRIYHNLILESEDLPDFDIAGDFIADIADYEGSTFIATANKGIYSIPYIENRNRRETTLSIFPNPSTEKINFCIRNPSSQSYTITVTDLSGKMVLYKNLLNVFDPEIECDELLIPYAGEYILQCVSNDEKLQGRILITK